MKHVLAHGVPDPNKPIHSVFGAGTSGTLQEVDAAWANRGAARAVIPQPNGNTRYDIPMNGPVGTNGEDHVRIVVRTGTSDIQTAHPIGDLFMHDKEICSVPFSQIGIII